MCSSLKLAQENEIKGVREVHVSNMADCGILKGTITGDIIFCPSHFSLRCPIVFSTAWINTEIPILLPKTLTYVFQSFHYMHYDY